MGVHEQWLGVGIGNDTYALLAMELMKLALEFCAEICALKIVYGTFEALCLLAECGHAATFSPKM